MKSLFRVIPFAICVGLTLGFCGCSNDNQTNSSEASSTPATYFDGSETHPIEASSVLSALSSGAMDIQYESEDDTLKTITVNLGMSSDSLKELLPEDAVSRSENESYIHFSTGMARIYFTNDDSPNGIVAIVQFGDAFGFSPTITTKQAVTGVMGTPESEGELEPEAASAFLFGASGATYVSYSSSDNTVRFIFTPDGYLQATTISKQGLWIY